MTKPTPITICLTELRRGDRQAFDRLVGLLYNDLRHLARIQLAQGGPPTLNPTALVHEAYVKLSKRDGIEYEDRSHFLAACSVVMRNIIIDFARRKKARKRGGGRRRVPLDDGMLTIDDQVEDLLAVDLALSQMEKLGPRMVRVVECRFFGGLTEEETAEALETSPSTVRREWSKARAVLRKMLGDAA